MADQQVCPTIRRESPAFADFAASREIYLFARRTMHASHTRSAFGTDRFRQERAEFVPQQTAANVSRAEELESRRMQPPLTRTGSAAKRQERRTRVRPLVQRKLDTSHVYGLCCRVILNSFTCKWAGADRFEVFFCEKCLVQSVLAHFHV